MRTSGSSFLPDHNFLLMQRYKSPVKNVASILQRTFRGEKHFFPSERRDSNSFHYRNHATHRIRDWIHEMHFQLFWRRIHFNNLNIIQIPVCFAFWFHFLHLFSRSWQNSSTKRRWGQDIRFGPSPMFICEGETQYFCARAVAYTPCNDHWRANVLICGQWVWYGTPLTELWLSSSVLVFLGELLGLLTNFYWSSQRTSSNWLAWELSHCARLTSGTRFHLRLKAAYLSLSLKLSLRATFCKYHE